MVGKLYIYAKDGSTRCVLNKWEFHDTFMGEQYLQFDKESAVQIDFEVGDYAIYRGERFEINVKPTYEQVSKPESGGVAFKYTSVKMDSLRNELTKCSLLDITPTTYQYIASEGTNYTGSTNFTMYCIETTVTMKKQDGTTVNVLLHPVEYLCGVIQANLDRLYGRENGWKIYVNPEAEKSDDVVLNVSNWTCEQALAEVHNTFELDYSVRGRNIYVGYSLQNITGLDDEAFLFGYGKGYAQHGDDGKSLISVKRTSNSSQQIVTRLRVMGSVKNMPYRYYNKKYNLPQALFVENLQLPNTYVGTGIKYDVPGLRKVMGDTNDAYIEKDDDAASTEEGIVESFAAWDGSNSDLKEIYPTIKEATYYELRRADGITDIDGIGGTTAFPHYGDDERIDQILSVGSTCNFGSGIMPEADVVGETGETKDVAYNTSLNSSQFHINGSVYVGPSLHICSFDRKYLPGKYTLSMTNENVFAEFGKVAGYDPGYQISIWLGSTVGAKDTLLYYDNKKGRNSALTQRDKVQIDNLPAGSSDSIELTTEGYISVYIEPLYFKRANDSFSFTGMPFGIVSDQEEIEPHMIWNYLDAADTFVNTPFNIILKDLGFDIRTLEKATDDSPKIHINTGACAGRELEISLSDAEVINVGNKKGWNVRVVGRAIDNSIKRYFPSENDPLVAGDDYVITGVAMPDAYIKMAEVRLLQAATDYLADNCETKYIYEPQLDNVYVQRNYDNNVAAGTPGKSVYMNLYAGLKFSMYGLPIDGGYEIIDNVTIQSVTIKEGESNVPSVEIVLNNDIDQSTIDKITTSVDRIYGSIFGKNANVLSAASTNSTLISLINKEGSKRFLSKEANDVAQGIIGFAKGLWVKAKELFGFDGEGNIKANNVEAAGNMEVGGLLTALSQVVNNAQSTNYVSGELTGTGWKLTNDNGEGNSRLEIDEIVARMRIVASVLEARKYQALGGNYVFSPASSIIDRVDYLKDIIYDSGSFVPDIYYGAGNYVISSSLSIPAGASIYLSNEAGYNDIWLTDENYNIIETGRTGSIFYTAEEEMNVKVMTGGQPTVTYKIYQENVIMGYEEVKVPWLLRKMPLWARNAMSSRYKKVHVYSSDFDPAGATRYRCWIKADDGTTKTINTWRAGMLARCQTLDINQSPDGNHKQTFPGSTVAGANKFYWRAVVSTGTGRLPIDDGYDRHYVDLSNESGKFYPVADPQEEIAGADMPSAGDSIVCFGDYLNQDTSHFIVIETVGEDAPAIKEYKSVGYVGNGTINWSLEGKMRTRISPTTGNIFIAPSFIVEIPGRDNTNLATWMVNEEGMISEVQGQIANGKNLFDGVLTGKGWYSEASVPYDSHPQTQVTVDEDGYLNVRSGGNYICKSVTIEKGIDYTLSLYGKVTSGFNVPIFSSPINSSSIPISTLSFNAVSSASTRREKSFKIIGTGSITILIAIPLAAIRYPQIELGTAATAFDSGSTEMSSRIKQAADRIDLSVTNMETGLEAAGVHLDGQNSEIKLLANKVNFYDASGNNLNAKIWIAPTTGTLHAVDGDFSGTVTAKNLYRRVVLTHNTYQMTNLGDEIQGLSDEQLTWVMIIDKQGVLDELDDLEYQGYDVQDLITFVNGLSVGSYVQYKDIFPHGNDLPVSLPYYLAQAIDDGLVLPTTYDAEDVRALDGWNGSTLEPYGNYSGSGNLPNKNILFLPKASDFPNKMVTIDHTYANRVAANQQDIMVYEASDDWTDSNLRPFVDGTGHFVSGQHTLTSYSVDVYIGTRCSFYSNGVKWYFLREYSSTQQQS